ncbi:MAG TPA: alpha/beta fold hydrolase [Sandaracinaceae bacterium LLY-WYZ-13_1]|nr:alpha/beta fold hydrolase [Sandaracinaceae bacterium LLY-WYZ-13_1]
MTREKRFARRRGGQRLYYEIGGRADAPPLLLIRGLSRSSSYWLEYRELLERERRVLVLDNRGVGRSDSPRGVWTTEAMADDAAAVLADSGVQRADVFGISLGGMIAQQLALRHPHRVDRLVLACTTPGGRAARRIEPRALAALARTATMPFDEAIRFSAPWALSEPFLARRPEIVDIWVAIAASEPRSRRGQLGQLWAAARHDASPHLRHLAHPTLLLTGDADRLVSPTNSERLEAALPRASMRTLRGAGHDFPTERPEETRDLVMEFLTRP